MASPSSAWTAVVLRPDVEPAPFTALDALPAGTRLHVAQVSGYSRRQQAFLETAAHLTVVNDATTPHGILHAVLWVPTDSCLRVDPTLWLPLIPPNAPPDFTA